MSKLSLQFHAMPDEISTLSADLINDASVFTTKISGTPLGFTQLGKGEFVRVDPTTRALAFTLSAPNLSAQSFNAFRSANPDALILSIGQIGDRGLAESWLSAMSENEAAMKRWRKTASRLRSETLTGAMAVNPRNGATALMKDHRFTVGVKKANLNGLLLLPAAGNSVVRLPS